MSKPYLIFVAEDVFCPGCSTLDNIWGGTNPIHCKCMNCGNIIIHHGELHGYIYDDAEYADIGKDELNQLTPLEQMVVFIDKLSKHIAFTEYEYELFTKRKLEDPEYLTKCQQLLFIGDNPLNYLLREYSYKRLPTTELTDPTGNYMSYAAWCLLDEPTRQRFTEYRIPRNDKDMEDMLVVVGVDPTTLKYAYPDYTSSGYPVVRMEQSDNTTIAVTFNHDFTLIKVVYHTTYESVNRLRDTITVNPEEYTDIQLEAIERLGKRAFMVFGNT